MGSPEFAVPSLRALHEHFPVVGVVTQPDRKAGRGRKLISPPVKVVADELGLPTIQPRSLRKPDAFAMLEAWQPDLIVVAAFGQILRKNVLEHPKYGCINVHASLLPRWRGAAPIRASILHGDAETGVTIMQMDAGLDTGPMLKTASIPIQTDDTGESLTDKIADLGATLLIPTLRGYLSGDIVPQPQPDEGITYAPQLTKSDGQLDFTQSAEWLARQVRAYTPWPGTFFEWQEKPLKVLAAHAEPGQAVSGKTRVIAKRPAIGTADGWLVLDQVQPAGKKSQPGKVFLNGARAWGDVDLTEN